MTGVQVSAAAATPQPARRHLRERRVVGDGVAGPSGSTSGQRGASARMISERIIGSVASSSEPAAAISAPVSPSGSFPAQRGLPKIPASTGSVTTWNARQSRALSRWIVPRITTVRTTARDSTSALSDSGSEVCEPAPQRDVRVQRLLRLHPGQPLDHREREAWSCAPENPGAPAACG